MITVQPQPKSSFIVSLRNNKLVKVMFYDRMPSLRVLFSSRLRLLKRWENKIVKSLFAQKSKSFIDKKFNLKDIVLHGRENIRIIFWRNWKEPNIEIKISKWRIKNLPKVSYFQFIFWNYHYDGRIGGDSFWKKIKNAVWQKRTYARTYATSNTIRFWKFHQNSWRPIK